MWLKVVHKRNFIHYKNAWKWYNENTTIDQATTGNWQCRWTSASSFSLRDPTNKRMKKNRTMEWLWGEYTMTYDLLQKFYSSLSTRTTTAKKWSPTSARDTFFVDCHTMFWVSFSVVGLLCAARCVIGLRIQDTGRALIQNSAFTTFNGTSSAARQFNVHVS